MRQGLQKQVVTALHVDPKHVDHSDDKARDEARRAWVRDHPDEVPWRKAPVLPGYRS